MLGYTLYSDPMRVTNPAGSRPRNMIGKRSPRWPDLGLDSSGQPSALQTSSLPQFTRPSVRGPWPPLQGSWPFITRSVHPQALPAPLQNQHSQRATPVNGRRGTATTPWMLKPRKAHTPTPKPPTLSTPFPKIQEQASAQSCRNNSAIVPPHFSGQTVTSFIIQSPPTLNPKTQLQSHVQCASQTVEQERRAENQHPRNHC